MEGREFFPWRDKKERTKEGFRYCGIEFAQEENLSEPWTGEQEVLSVPVFFCKQLLELKLGGSGIA